MVGPGLPNHPYVEMMARDALIPNANNPRTHSGKQLHQIAASIERFGFLVPLIVDDANRIIAGHGRWQAAGLINYDPVPAIRARFLSEADRRAFALTDNRIAELSGWDDELLQAELNDLFQANYDFTVTGFELSDLDFSIGDKEKSDQPKQENVELPDEDAEAVTRTGDLWLVGPHRIYCGNALDTASYEALLGDRRAAMVFTDPPYNVPVNGHVSGLGKVRHREFAMASGEMTRPEFIHFLRSVFRNCVRFSRDGSIHYHCMDWRHMTEMLDAADGVYHQFKQLIVWTKDNAGMGAFYRSAHELVFTFKAGKEAHTNNFGLGETGRYRTNVWNYAGANTFRKGRDEDLSDHPTVKPVAMVADAMLDCSNRGDIILDPFLGSGTTLVAAHRTGRVGAGIEIDRLYVDTALRRLGEASGLPIVHADGRSFEDVVAERRSQRRTANG